MTVELEVLDVVKAATLEDATFSGGIAPINLVEKGFRFLSERTSNSCRNRLQILAEKGFNNQSCRKRLQPPIDLVEKGFKSWRCSKWSRPPLSRMLLSRGVPPAPIL